jgi:hypothetical protein
VVNCIQGLGPSCDMYDDARAHMCACVCACACSHALASDMSNKLVCVSCCLGSHGQQQFEHACIKMDEYGYEGANTQQHIEPHHCMCATVIMCPAGIFPGLSSLVRSLSGWYLIGAHRT